MNKWLVIFLFCLSNIQAQQTLFEKGFDAFENREYEKAIEFYTQYIEKDGTLNTYYNRGLAYYYAKNFEAAILDFSIAIDLDSLDFEAYYNRGIIFYKQKKYPLAINDFEESIAINPEFSEAYTYLGLINYEKENFQEAIIFYDKAISINSTKAMAFYNRALCYQGLKKYEQAEIDFRLAIEAIESSTYYWGLANLYFDQKRYADAVEQYEKAIELDSTNPILFFNKGICYYENNQFEPAIEDFKQSIALNNKDIDARWYLVLSHKALGNIEQALNFYKEVEALNPNYEFLNTINKSELQIKKAVAEKMVYKILLGIMILIALILAFKIFFRKEEAVRKVD